MGVSHRYPYIVLMPQFVLSPIKGSALELLDKEVNALESVQRELVRKITRAKYGLTEDKEE